MGGADAVGAEEDDVDPEVGQGAHGLAKRRVVILLVKIQHIDRVGPQPPQAVVESKIAPYIIEASDVLSAVAPRELRDGFDDGYAKVKESWKGMMGKGLSRLPGNAF